MSKTNQIRGNNQERAKAFKGSTFRNLQDEFLSKNASWRTKHNTYRDMTKFRDAKALRVLLGTAAELSFTATDRSARDELFMEAVDWSAQYGRHATHDNPHTEIDYALQSANLRLQTRLFIEHRHPSLEEKYDAQKFVTRALTEARKHHHTQIKAAKETNKPLNVSDYVGSASEAIGFILLSRAAVELVRDESWTPVTTLYSQKRKDTGARGSSENWDISVITAVDNPFEPAHKVQLTWNQGSKQYDDDVAVVSLRKTLRLPDEARPQLGMLIHEIGRSRRFDLHSEQLQARTQRLLDSIE